MTNEELERKAFEYRLEVVPETYLGYPDVEIPMYSALDIDWAYIAGAKEMQKENEDMRLYIKVLKSEIAQMKNGGKTKPLAEVVEALDEKYEI